MLNHNLSSETQKTQKTRVIPEIPETPENVSPVKHDNSCFQYGFPSLFELNEIHSYRQSNQREMKEINRGFSYLGISHILTNHQELRCGKSILNHDTTQENNQFYSLFHYDLLFNKINKEKLLSQNCSCCPFLDLSKSSCNIQRQNDSIITKKDDDSSYVRSISVKHIHHIPEKSLELKKIANQSDNSLKDIKMLINKHEDTTSLIVPSKVNHDMTKPDDEPIRVNKVTKITDKSVDGDLNELGNMITPNVTILNVSMPKEKTIHNNNNVMNDDYKFKPQPSTLTVEKVQRILEFYHSTSNDFTFEKNIQENNDYSDYSSSDEKDSFNNVDFFDISNVNLLKCSHCDKEFSDKNSREKHIKNDHKFICKIRNTVSFHSKQVQLHDEKVHDNYIKKKPKRRSSRQTKRKRNPGTVRTYSCCGQTFKTGREFGIHKSTHKFMNNRRDVNSKI
jgi:hypothetical protein